MFDYQGINVVPTLNVDPFCCHLCRECLIARSGFRARTPRNLAFWGLFTQGIVSLPIPGGLLHFVLAGWFPTWYHHRIFLIAPMSSCSCFPLMIVSSVLYGFATIDHARDEQLIPWRKGRKYKWGLPSIADLVAAIWLYARLRRLDGTAPTCAGDDPLSPHTTPTRCRHRRHPRYVRPTQTRKAIPHP